MLLIVLFAIPVIQSLIPISTDESFRIEYNISRGMEIEFYNNNNIVLRQRSVYQ